MLKTQDVLLVWRLFALSVVSFVKEIEPAGKFVIAKSILASGHSNYKSILKQNYFVGCSFCSEGPMGEYISWLTAC